MKPLKEIFNSTYSQKYGYTVTDGLLVYHWSERNNELIKNPRFYWESVFYSREAIEYINKVKIEYDFKDRSNDKVNELTFEISSITPTGYIIPRFNFISSQFNNYYPQFEVYSSLLKHFDLKEGETFTYEKLPLIICLRDALMQQLNRQVNAITCINDKIISVLKVYYYETENSILRDYSSSSKNINKKENDINNFKVSVQMFYEGLISTGAPSKLIEDHAYTNDMLNCEFSADDLRIPTRNGIMLYTKERDLILNAALKIAQKVIALESIVEDMIFHEKIRSSDEFKKARITKNEIVNHFKNLKTSGMKVEKAFLEIRKWLFDELKFTNEEIIHRFNIKSLASPYDYESFNRFANQYKL